MTDIRESDANVIKSGRKTAAVTCCVPIPLCCLSSSGLSVADILIALQLLVLQYLLRSENGYEACHVTLQVHIVTL